MDKFEDKTYHLLLLVCVIISMGLILITFYYGSIIWSAIILTIFCEAMIAANTVLNWLKTNRRWIFAYERKR